MATLAEMYALRYETGTIKNRVTAAIANAANVVLNEDVGTANHAERVAWAKKAMVSTQDMADKMLWAVLGVPAIEAAGEASSDADIQTAVNSWLNAFALSL